MKNLMLLITGLFFLTTLSLQAQRQGGANLDANVKGANVNVVEFNDGKTTSSFKQTTLSKWEEYDASGKRKFRFEETGRDEWSVYMIDKTRGGMKIALDLWQKKVKIDGKAYYDITKAEAVTNGTNVKSVTYNSPKTKGSFKQTGDKKWGEYDTNGKMKNQFDETGRDEWSVYMIDKTRGGMKIALDLWQKKVKIDGTAYYDITKASTTVAPTTAPSKIDTDYYYRLSNSFLKEERSLDTYSNGNNEPFMGKTGAYSGQMWKLTPLGNGYYRLTNSFLGEGRSLDTYSGKENKPFMGKTGNYSGQMWKLTPIGNGNYRLTNSFLKQERSLDTYSNGENQPFMGKTGAYSGQMWKLTKLRKIRK